MTATHPQGRLTSSDPKDRCSKDVQASITAHLMASYGPLLNAEALATALKFPSVGALERSLARGNLSVRTVKFQHRRGTFALAHEVARYLAEQVSADESQEPEKGPGERGA
jgi:hypothetical protein